MDALNERISEIIEYSKLSSSEFADEVDVQRSSISHITSGRNKPSLDFLVKVKYRFPELEWEWLINGEGEMLKADSENIQKNKTTSLPDLFSFIEDDKFGTDENANNQKNVVPRESDIPITTSENEKIRDSQQLDIQEKIISTQVTENQSNKIKRIVLFFENGKFESYDA